MSHMISTFHSGLPRTWTLLGLTLMLTFFASLASIGVN